MGSESGLAGVMRTPRHEPVALADQNPTEILAKFAKVPD